MSGLSFDDLIPAKGGAAPASGGLSFDDLVPGAGQATPSSGLRDALARRAGLDPADPAFQRIDGAKAALRRGGEDLVRSVASGATFGLADEAQAGLDTLTRGGSYDENVAAQRQRDREISPYVRIPGEIAGGLATGTGLSRAGLTLLNVARPTVANMALRGAAEGAAYGAGHGFGNGEGTEDSLKGAARGMVAGAATGGLTGAVAGKIADSAARRAIPSTDDLKAQANAAYQASRDAGLVLEPQSFSSLVDDIAADAAKGGLDRTLHPRATAALARLQEAKGSSPSLENVDTLRQVLSDAAGSPDRGERRLASMMIDRLDKHVENLSPGDVVAGDTAGASALAEARGLWSRMRKSDTIDELMKRAETRGGQFSGSGLENAMRTEFRGLAMNPKRMRGFAPDEQDAIKRVAAGGPIENGLRALGKYAPTGVVPGALGMGAGYMAGDTVGAGLGAGIGAIAVPLIGGAARKAATTMTRGNVQAASDLVRAGGQIPRAPLSPRAQGILGSLLIGEAQEAPNLLDALRFGGAPAGLGARSR